MRNLILLTASVILSACTLSPTGTFTGSTQRYETHNDVMSAWVGKSEQELLNHWGNPKKTIQNSANTKTVIFIKNNPYTILACVSVFELDQGKVTKWGNRGCPIRDNKKNYKLVHKSTPVPQPTLDIVNIQLDS